MLIRRVARPMLAAAFVTQGVESLRHPHAAGEAARLTLEGLEKLPGTTGDGVPADPDVVAKVTAAAQIGGGLLLATGRLPRLAAATLAVSVIPANLGSHMFWDERDPVRKSRKRRDFMVDVSLLGGLIIAAADTAGKPSLGWRGRRAAHRASEAVTLAAGAAGTAGLADKVSRGLQAGAERSRDLAESAAERGAPVIEAARKRGAETAGTAAKVARRRGKQLLAGAKTEGKRAKREVKRLSRA